MNNSKSFMPLLDHIDDLRKCIIKIILSILFFSGLSMLNRKILFDYIIFAPSKHNFITYRLLNNLFNYIGIDKKEINFLILTENLNIQNRYLFGQFNCYILTSIFSGFILSIPYIIYQLWLFIEPALYKTEKKKFIYFFIFSLLLFIIGILFGYFFICPIIIQFGFLFKVSYTPNNIFDLYDYISIIMKSVFSMGLVFLFPLVIYLLSINNILNPMFLKKYRKHFFLILLIISAAITPSDILSTIITFLPLLLLYEITIFIVFFLKKK